MPDKKCQHEGKKPVVIFIHENGADKPVTKVIVSHDFGSRIVGHPYRLNFAGTVCDCLALAEYILSLSTHDVVYQEELVEE